MARRISHGCGRPSRAYRAASNPDERAHVASVGWAKRALISAAAIDAHLIVGAGLFIGNRRRPAPAYRPAVVDA